MGTKIRACGAAFALSTLLTPPAGAQGLTLPEIDVGWSRLGSASESGIAGSSTSIITAQDIERSTNQSLPEILSEQAGIQVQHVIGGTNGSRDVVDLRGFGASATSNVLVLVNGRRFNDFDLQGFDYSAIPINSIERIEITRGNSGAVLYGDGAVGGVINIVTKTGVNRPTSARIEGAFSSFRGQEGRFNGNTSVGPFSTSISAVGMGTDGYRQNSQLRQRGANGDARFTTDEGGVYFNVLFDDQTAGLPGGRTVDPSIGLNELETNRRGAATPNDYANKQGQNFIAGFNRKITQDLEFILDGSIRRKQQQGELLFGGVPFNGVDSRLTTGSLTPRFKLDTNAGGLPLKVITGFDYYRTDYASNRAMDLVSAPYHVYGINQTTAGFYANGTLGVRPDTDITLGGRYQHNSLSARDTYDPTAPFGFGDAQGLPLDRGEWKYAAQAGIEHRINPILTLFGHVAHSFRVPNADERIGQAVSFNFPTPTPTNFDLRTQTSNEVEAGYRIHLGRFDLQTSVYDMHLTDEIFYSPATGTNVNLDPTRHYGVENIATYRLTDTVRLKGGLTYTRAVFREGLFAGNDIPLISRWSGNAGLSWDVWKKWIVYDMIVRYSGQRRLDNDSANTQTPIPSRATLDVRLGGEVDRFFWSIAVQNVFNDYYYDYGIASTFTPGRFAAYPQPGRTYMVRAGATF